MKEIHEVTNVPIYRADIIIFITDGNFRDRMFIKFGEKIKKSWLACAIYRPKEHACLIAFEHQYLCHGIIAHEIHHAAGHIMDAIGHRTDSIGNDESTAYLCQWITEWVYAQLKKRKVAIK